MAYDPTNPTVYFDIGEAIAALGLILAFMALSKPITRFRLSVGWFRQTDACWMFFIGVLFVFLAAAVRFLPERPPYISGYPIFWEAIGGLFFFGGTLGLILTGSVPSRFSCWNAQRYLHGCYSFIAQADRESLVALAGEIKQSISDIVAFAQSHSATGKDLKDRRLQTSEYARALLDLWADRRFCEMIVTSCPQTAMVIIKELQKDMSYPPKGWNFVTQLLREAYENTDSILHREKRGQGLGLFASFTNLVFGNYAFVSGYYRPLQAWRHWEDDHKRISILEKYGDTLVVALRSYFNAGKFREPMPALHVGMQTLSECVSWCCRSARGDSNVGHDRELFWIAHYISQTYRKMLELVAENEGKLPEYNFDVKQCRSHGGDDTLFGALASGVYAFFDSLSHCQLNNNDTSIRDAAIDMWLEVYPPSANREKRTHREIQMRFEPLLVEQIEKNLKQEHMCYPMITRLLVNIVGLYEKKTEAEGEARVTAMLHSLLRSHFEGAAKLTEKRGSEVLPEGYQYKKRKRSITYKNKWMDEPLEFSLK